MSSFATCLYLLLASYKIKSLTKSNLNFKSRNLHLHHDIYKTKIYKHTVVNETSQKITLKTYFKLPAKTTLYLMIYFIHF